MNETNDFAVWKSIAKCQHIWDLDVRGFHKSMWRLFLKSHHVLIIGVPASPYSDTKPANIEPVMEVKENTPSTQR